MRALLPKLVNAPIQLGCCLRTTVRPRFPKAAGKSEAEEVWSRAEHRDTQAIHAGACDKILRAYGSLLSSFVSGNDVQRDQVPINASRRGPRVCWRKPASIRT